jgi:hypothetical protein
VTARQPGTFCGRLVCICRTLHACRTAARSTGGPAHDVIVIKEINDIIVEGITPTA